MVLESTLGWSQTSLATYSAWLRFRKKIHIHGQQVKTHLTQVLYFQPSPDEMRPLDHESTMFLIPAVLKDANNKFIIKTQSLDTNL